MLLKILFNFFLLFSVTEYKRPAQELWTSPSDQFFLRGETLRLKCIFAGRSVTDIFSSFR